MKQETETIRIRGARVNNLKNIDLDIPRGKLVVLTGVSGSGKSSLAFDTLFAEGQRRFAESVSSFARQFLGRMSKPAVDQIAGIPPAIAISQKVTTRNPRSTVASSTEIYDYLRLLFARAGHTYSPVSGREVHCDSAASAAQWLFERPGTDYVLILADIRWKEDGQVEKLLALKERGFTRLAGETGELFRIEQVLQERERFSKENLFLMVDRIRSEKNEDNLSRALDSIQTAFAEGEGNIRIGNAEGFRDFCNRFEADGIHFETPTEYLFSYNSPLGACPVCGGFGKITGIDEALVVPDPSRSVYDDAIACWRGEVMKSFKDEVVLHGGKYGFPIHKPYCQLTPEQKELLWSGNGEITGIDRFFTWVESQRYKIQYRYMLSRYSGKTTCRACGGSRLRKEAHYVRLGGEGETGEGGKTLPELMKMPIGELARWMEELPGRLSEYDRQVAARPLQEIRQRLACIIDVGLSYLTLDRPSNTLSGGESQRISLVSSLGNNLVGSMYILDEPSIGLHERDTARLIEVLKRLRDLGNTVIVVEHDEQIMRAADHLIDIGPGAGTDGGQVVFQGSPGKEGAALAPGVSITLDYLSGRRKLSSPASGRPWRYAIEVVGAMENNLKDITVRFPLRSITAVTGVSGSGKSSLVGDILYPALLRRFEIAGDKPGIHRALRGDLDRITSVEYVDQNPIGKSSRSNPATYLKIFDEIRRLFAEQPYARMNGYGPGHFSFNSDGGRCPDCQGEGVIKIEMQFMADVSMVCDTCGGKRFMPDILEVRYRDKNIYDVLQMTVEEAAAFFGEAPEDPLSRRIVSKLQPLMDVGLSYVKLGQSSSSLSGGESQRIKLASFLGRDFAPGESILFIFDEPTTGLHRFDVEKLLKTFNALVAKGHSILVVEHNLDVIRASDWIIELGPEAGEAGGNVIFEGTPQELVTRRDLPTGGVL